ncbi:MAG: MmcB family DNA repair protein [Alphaproteobacteria bacterium]|nr:MmcB family DNA repair protein [Alphaproteobacteria bacterium]MBU0798231.1 MmcB family DNA repair protein [Alphaproteobacteria bacterium]MBU0888623.1 MmcB family DNA repair protein [Alphaproteobacteria bacterium]MBU1813643.1 MmcB family DNA repair protein [Alphaproteobacteria bacterium]
MSLGLPPATAADIVRGVCRLLAAHGHGTLAEITLRTGRRVDVMALAPDGTLTVVEVKSSLQDYRSDRKWRDYLEFCDRFFFAVGETFPTEILPPEPGLIIADRFGAVILRDAPATPLAPARRKALIQKFALTGSQRLTRLLDPECGV